MNEDMGLQTGDYAAETRQPAARATEGAPQYAQPTSPQSASAQPAPYVRQRPQHRTVEAIDDFAMESEPNFAHDSDYVTRGSALSGRGYRQSRRDSRQLRRDLHYGQYLEVPKGRKDIFASRERKTRVKTVLALIVVLAVLAVVVYYLWNFMNATWGEASVPSIG